VSCICIWSWTILIAVLQSFCSCAVFVLSWVCMIFFLVKVVERVLDSLCRKRRGTVGGHLARSLICMITSPHRRSALKVDTYVRYNCRSSLKHADACMIRKIRREKEKESPSDDDDILTPFDSPPCRCGGPSLCWL
jgi:hypothetical protein